MQSIFECPGSAVWFYIIKHDIVLFIFTVYYNHLKIKPGKLELFLSFENYINSETVCLVIQTKSKIEIILIQCNYCY